METNSRGNDGSADELSGVRCVWIVSPIEKNSPLPSSFTDPRCLCSIRLSAFTALMKIKQPPCRASRIYSRDATSVPNGYSHCPSCQEKRRAFAWTKLARQFRPLCLCRFSRVSAAPPWSRHLVGRASIRAGTGADSILTRYGRSA
jgi:hypothetical protein